MAEKKEDQAAKAAKKRELLDALIPGTKVPLIDAAGKPFGDAIVYPLGVRQVRKFGQGIVTVFRVILAGLGKDVDGKAPAFDERRLMEQAGPLLLSMLPELLAECVRIEPEGTDLELDDLPHWCLAPIATAWVQQSFGNGRWRPWKEAFEGLSAAMPQGVAKAPPVEATGTSSPASGS